MKAEPAPLTVAECRRARRLGYWNGGLWAAGNGMISGTLVIYLALDLGAPGIGLSISLIKAAPQLAGLLRLGAPALIGRLGNRKGFCIGGYLLSVLVLLGLPAAAVPGWLPSATLSVIGIVLLWCLYHLLEYLATVALWSWLADLVPVRIRGRFLGRRERWMVTGQAVTMLATAAFSYQWNLRYPKSFYPEMVWLGYAIPAVLGACFLMVSLGPLLAMPNAGRDSGRTVKGSVPRSASGSSLLAPFLDRRFLRLLLFGCWFSFFNGLTQSAQEIYPARVLGIGLFAILVLRTAMRLGQLTISPWMGRLADRWGNRPVMLVCLPLVATGTLFYFAATPEQPAWFAGAWAVWIAYAGINVCLPNLMLKLSPGESRAAYVAAFYAITGVCVAASTIAGGALLDALRDRMFLFFDGAARLDCYQSLFLAGWITRTLGVVLLWRVLEPATRQD